MEQYGVYVPRLAPSKEYFAPGHRACIGCGEVLALRLVCKALGRDIIVANATGCMEIVSSPLPNTSWRVPWIHTLFENTSAVAAGIESALKILQRQGKISGQKIWQRLPAEKGEEYIHTASGPPVKGTFS